MKNLLLSVLFVFILAVGTAYATPVTYYFDGTLDNSFGTLDQSTPFSGSFSYDDATVALGSNNWSATYGLTAFDITFDTLINGTPNSTLTVSNYESNYYSMDRLDLDISPASGSIVGGIAINYLVLNLFDYSGNVFSDTSAPGQDMTMDDFNSSCMIALSSTNGITAYGHLNFLSDSPITPTAPVPEPCTLLLMGTGLVGVAGMKLRKKKDKK